jgi:hypothetical protein
VAVPGFLQTAIPFATFFLATGSVSEQDAGTDVARALSRVWKSLCGAGRLVKA